MEPMQKVMRYRWWIFFLLALSYILVYFHRLCPGNSGDTLLGIPGTPYLISASDTTFFV